MRRSRRSRSRNGVTEDADGVPETNRSGVVHGQWVQVVVVIRASRTERGEQEASAR
jgi:hypothetical protein